MDFRIFKINIIVKLVKKSKLLITKRFNCVWIKEIQNFNADRAIMEIGLFKIILFQHF